MNILTTSYKKALKVIDSCENETQLEGAKRYINNFFLFFATQKNTSMGKLFKVIFAYNCKKNNFLGFS